jgi:hypothetical protein
MAWDVRLQDENGKPVVPKDAGVEPKLIPLDGQYRLLHYIDPYGDTYFNRLQMSDFLLDWDSLHPDTGETNQWMFVREMALRCKNEAHLYLRFIGD